MASAKSIMESNIMVIYKFTKFRVQYGLYAGQYILQSIVGTTTD